MHVPARLSVVDEELVDEGLDLDEPAGDRPVDKRGVATPAERVAVDNGAAVHEPAGSLEVLDDVLVGVLDVLAGKVGHLGSEAADFVERQDRDLALGNDAVLEANTAGRTLVHGKCYETGREKGKHVEQRAPPQTGSPDSP